jgi:hypothetical protein
MGEFDWVRQAPIGHHSTKLLQTRVGEKQPGKTPSHIQTHQAAVQQALGDGRDFGLTCLRPTSPVFKLKPLSDRRVGGEKHIQLPSYKIPLTRGKFGGG